MREATIITWPDSKLCMTCNNGLRIIQKDWHTAMICTKAVTLRIGSGCTHYIPLPKPEDYEQPEDN